MASIDAQIQIMLKGTSQLKALQGQLDGIEQTINQISGQAIDVVLGRVTDVTTYANALKHLNNERQKAAGILQSEVEQTNKRNQAIRQSLVFESALRKERSFISRYTREFAVETKGLNQSSGTLKEIKERFENIRGAVASAFNLGDIGLIRSLRTELRTLVQEQRDWNRSLTGTKNTGVNADFLKEQARGYSNEIRALRERATVLGGNEEILRKLAAAEYNLVKQRTESGTFTSFADPRLGRELLSNAKALITQEEKRAKVIEDTAKANERLSSAAVSLEKQKQAALEKTFAVEEKIRSGRRISRSEAADYYFQAQLPRLALPFGDPSAPSMRGGARRTGISRELLGGARTAEEAQAAFRTIEERGSKAAKKVKQSFVDAYREILPPDTLLDGLTALGKTGKTVINSLEGRAKAAQDIAKENERLSSAAVSLEKQRRAALEKIFAVEEKIRSSRRISRSEAEDYYFQAQLPRLALPFGDPSAPSMRGGARRTGVSRELLGGARTTEEAQAAFRAIEERGSKAAKNIKQSFVKAYREMLPPDTLLDGFTALGKAGKTILNSLQKKTVTGSGGFAAALPAEEIRKQRNQIIAELRQVAPGVDSAGDNITSTFASSIRDGASSAVAATTTFAEAAKKALKKAFGIASPSRFMIELVRILVDTYVAEMQKSYPRIQAATDRAFGQLTPERSVKKLIATSRGFELSSVPSTQYRALPIRSFDPSGEGGEMDEMLRRFRAQIASLTTQPEIYRNLLNALPSSRITTDLAGAASRRAIASEIPSFMSTQRMLGPGELERVIAKAAADYFRTVRTPDLPPGQRIAGALPPALFESGLSPSQEIRRINAYRRSAERAASVMAESGPRQLALPPASTVDAASSTGQRNVRQAISDLFDRISTAVRGAFGGGGGFGGRGAGGGAGGAGDPAGALARTSDVMRRLGSLSSLTNNQLEELEQQFVSLRNQADATGAEFRQLTQDLTRISREQARRDPDADILTRRFGPRAAQGISEGLIGGAFPLLFGQGLGASLGGLAGGGAGGFIGGNLGFGLSLLGTAFGDVYDRLNQAAQETGRSLNYPIEGFEKLKEAGLFASRQQEYYISKLIESGRTAEATAQVQAEMIRKIGVSGVNDLMRLGDASSDLSKAWAEFNLQLQAALAGPMAELLRWVTEIIAAGNQQRRDIRRIEDVRSGLSGADLKSFDKASAEITGLTRRGLAFGGITMDEATKRQLALAERYASRASIQLSEQVKQDPKQQEADLRKAMENAEKIRSLNQQGLDLQRSADELRRNNEDTIYSLRKRAADMEREAADFRRSIEDETFSKRQELEKMLIENERKRKQNAIDTVDLELQELASSLDPVSAGVVDAGREYIRFIGEAFADKEQREKTLTLDLVQMQRESDKFKLQVEDRVRQMNLQRDEFTRDVARTKTQMEFAALDYAKQVEAYRLQMAQRRLELAIEEGNVTKAAAIAARDGLVVQATGGYTGTKVDGFPITSRAGMRRHPITGEMREHRGVDVAAPIGTALGYEIGGKILSAGWIRGYGNTLKVELENGMTVLSAHLNEIFVEAGQKFRANQRLATVGSTGNSTGPHTHQESWINGKADPYASLPYLQLGKAVSGRPADSDIYHQPGVGWFSRKTGQMVQGPRTVQAPTSQIGRAQASASAMGLPVPPSPPPIPALPTAPGAVGVDDLMQDYESFIQRITKARKEGNKAEEEALQIRIKQAQAALVEKALQPVKAIQEQTQSMYDEIEARKLRNRLLAEGVRPEIAEGEVRVLEITRQFNKLIEGQDELLKKVNKGKFDSATAAYDAALARIAEISATQKLTPELEKERTELEGILRARKAIQDAQPGTIKGARDAAAASILSPREKIEDEIGRVQQELEKLNDPANMAISLAERIGSAFSESFKGIINGTMTAQEALAGFFQSIADYFLDMAAQIIAKWIQMAILNTVLKLFPSSGFSFGGPSGGFNTPGFQMPPYMDGVQIPPPGTFAKGGIFDSPALEKFANGGMFTNSIVSSPTLFKFADGGAISTGLMGEAGPEAIMPLKRGPGGRLGVDASGGGGDVNVTVNVDAKGTAVEGNDREGAALGRAISAAVQAEIVKQKRPGGLLTK